MNETRELMEQARHVKATLRDIYMECDGFYVYQQVGGGYLNEWALRLIANVLEDLNWSWEQEINTYMDDHP